MHALIPAAHGLSVPSHDVRVDEFLPTFDFSDEIGTAVAADTATTWDELVDADLIEVGRQRRLVAVLGAMRILPDLVSQQLHASTRPRRWRG